MNLRSFNYYVEGRVFEWVMSVAMIAVAVEILIWPQTAENNAFFWMSPWLSHGNIAMLLMTIGWMRCAALMLNGQRMFGSKLGPFIRAAGSVLSAFLWSQFAVTLLAASINQGYPSPGLPFWTMFTFGEVYAAYTTVKNGRSG
jgi:hypothetical protein